MVSIAERFLKKMNIDRESLPKDWRPRLSKWLWISFGIIIITLIAAILMLIFRKCETAKELANAFGSAASIGGFVLSLVILIWTVIDVMMAERSINHAKSQVHATQQKYDEFRDHVKHIAEFLSTEEIGAPAEVTIVSSTLLYGLQARKETVNKGAHDAKSVETFLQLLIGWVKAWEEHPVAKTPLLRICLWDKAKHREFFAVPTANGDSGDPDWANAIRSYAVKLRDILKRIKKLVTDGRLTVEFHVTDCNEVRLFLICSQGDVAIFRSILAVVTKLEKTSLNDASTRFLGFASSFKDGYDEYRKFALECCHLGDMKKEGAEPHLDPDCFVKDWFNLSDCDLSNDTPSGNSGSEPAPFSQSSTSAAAG